MRRELATVERLTLERGPALVPCCYADNREDRWRRRHKTCGALIPYKPNVGCPSCGHIQMRAQAPIPTQDSRILDRDTAIVDAATGEVVVVYVTTATHIASALLRSLRDVAWDKDVYWNVSTTTRLSGVAVTHRTFGYQPPQPIRRRYGCCRSMFNTEYPEAMDVLGEFCRHSELVFRTHAEDVYNRTATAVRDKIGAAWLIAGTPWSSGIINQTAALPYHVDKGNIPTTWSAMLGCRHNVADGLLHLADYDVYLPVHHGSITIFDGQSVCHGVTPFRFTGNYASRVTVVVYAKQQMAKCAADPADEARRAAIAVTEAEDRRLTGFRPKRPTRRRVLDA